MDADDVLALLREAGALKDGHFLLSSGRHGDRYIEKFDLLRRPRDTQAVCRAMVDRFRDRQVDAVVGPTTGGVIIAFEVARQLGCDAAYAERASEGSVGREIRRGTVFRPGTRVLVVDDILTTGGSIRETLAALAAHPVEVLAVAVLVDRSGGKVDLGVPIVPLVSLEIVTWAAEDGPLWARGIPLHNPGTTAVA